MTNFVEEKINSFQIKNKINPYVKCELDLLEKFRYSDLSIHAIAIHHVMCLTILKHSNFADVSISDLMAYCKCSKNTVIKALKELEKNNFITMNKMNGRQTFYQMKYAFNGQIEKNTDIKLNKSSSSHEPVKKYTGSPHEPLLGQTGSYNEPVPNVYIYNKTKQSSSSNYKKQKVDDRRSFKNHKKDQSKLSLCRDYLTLLKETKKVEIKTTEAQYIAKMYQNNDDAQSWEELKEKKEILAKEIEKKATSNKLNSTEKTVYHEFHDEPPKTDEEQKRESQEKEKQDTIKNLKLTGEYDRLKDAVLKNSENPEFLKGRFLDMEIILLYQGNVSGRKI